MNLAELDGISSATPPGHILPRVTDSARVRDLKFAAKWNESSSGSAPRVIGSATTSSTQNLSEPYYIRSSGEQWLLLRELKRANQRLLTNRPLLLRIER